MSTQSVPSLPKVYSGKKAPMTTGVQALLVKNLQATLDELVAIGVSNAYRKKAVKAELVRAMRGEW